MTTDRFWLGANRRVHAVSATTSCRAANAIFAMASGTVLLMSGCWVVPRTDVQLPACSSAQSVDPERWFKDMRTTDWALIRVYVREEHPSGTVLNEYAEAEYSPDGFKVSVWTFQQFDAKGWKIGPGLEQISQVKPAHVVELRGEMVTEQILQESGEYLRFEPYRRLEPFMEEHADALTADDLEQLMSSPGIPMTRARQGDPCLVGTLFTPWIGPTSPIVGSAAGSDSIPARVASAVSTGSTLDGQPSKTYTAGPHTFVFTADGLVSWTTTQRESNSDPATSPGIRRVRSYVVRTASPS